MRNVAPYKCLTNISTKGITLLRVTEKIIILISRMWSISLLSRNSRCCCGVDPAYTRKLKALMGILATSVPYELDITKLAGMIGLSRKLCHQLLTEFGQGGIAQAIVLGFTICQKMQNRIRFTYRIPTYCTP